MGIVFRQSVKTSLVVGMGAFMGAFITWLSTKYIPDKQQFGFIRNLTSQAVTLSQILLLGLSSTLFVYTHRYADDPRKRKMLITLCLLLPLVATILASMAYFFSKEWILRHYQPGDALLMRQYFIWLPIFTVMLLYMVILEQYLGSQMKVAVSAFMREVLLRILNLALILLYAFQYVSFNTLVAGTILIYLVPIIIFFAIASRTQSFGFSVDFRIFGKDEYKEMFHFAWYHFLLSISIILMSTLDTLSLPFYDHSGLSSVAVYAVANLVISFLLLPSKAFLPASFSILTTAFTENDMGKAKDIFMRSSLNLLIPTLGMAVLLSCNLENAVAIIGNGKNYSGIISVFLILMAGQLINLSTGMNDQVLSIANYYKFNFYVAIIVTGILYTLIRFLVPRYGIYGAAWSSTITIIIFNVMKYIFIWKKLGMQPFSSKTVLVVIAALPALAGGYFFPYLFDAGRHVYVHTFMDAAMRSAIIIIIYVLMLLWLKPSADLEEYMALVKKNKRLF